MDARNTILTWASIITLSIVTMTLAASTLLVSRQLARVATVESETKRAGEQSASRTDELARRNYLMHVANADKALLEQKVLRAQVELDACPPEQRGWEWSYLVQRMQATFPLRLRGHAPVFTRDGKRLIGSGPYGTSEQSVARVWDLKSGKVVNNLRHDSRLSCVAVSPDDLRIACGDFDGNIIVWDVKSGKKTFLDYKHGRFSELAFSPDGRLLACAHSDRRVVIVVDAVDGKEQYTLGPYQESPACVRFSPNGQWIVCGMEHTETPAMLFNAATGEVVAKFSEKGGDRVVAFAPHGQQIATGTVDGRIKVWSWDGNELSEVRSWRAARRAILSIAFDTGGTRLVSSDRMNNVKVWDFITEDPLAALSVRSEVYSLAFRPRVDDAPSNNELIVMGSPSGGLVLWRWRGGEHGTTVKTLDGAVEAKFSPDGQFILASTPMYFTGGDLYHHQHHRYPPESASVLNSQSAREVVTIDEAIYAATWSHDGQEIIATPTSGDAIRTYDAATGEPLRTFPGGTGRFTVSRISPNGERLVSFSSDKTIRTLDFESGEELITRQILGGANSIFHGLAADFSPDSQLIGIAGLDADIWDTRSGMRVSQHSQPGYWAKRFTFSNDGKHVYVGSSGGLLTQLDTATGKETKRFVGHSGYVLGIAIAPDEKQIVSGDRIGRVIVWDVASEQPLVTLTDGDQRITSLDWSSDGRRIVAGKEDGTVQIWTLPRSR